MVLRGGTYYLDSPLEFGPEDSGTEQAPVVYRAAAGEKVVLSGGRRLENGRWGEVNGHKAWVVDLAEVKAGTWRFRQLFVHGQRRPRTRLPQQGEYRIESLPGYTGDFLRSPTRQFVYAPGDIVPTWRNLRDVEVVGITRWLDNRLPIESVNGETRTVTFDRASLFALVSGSKPGLYWVENVFEALDTPGQWYLDRPRGMLYYLARPGEEMPSAEIIAPRLAQVVRVVGRADAPVHDLRFEGLIFAFNRIAQVERGGIGGFELTCRRNLVYFLEGKAVGSYGSRHCGRDVCAFDRNLYWNASGKAVLFANKSFSEWQTTGQDTDSLIADPLFVDPAQGDFSLRPASPAAQIGFEPWDLSAVGPRPSAGTSQ